jgi:uncharacterized cupin superfamily protein
MSETAIARLMIPGSEAASMELADWGLLEPPVGEALDGPMRQRGVEMWRSADGKILTGLWEVDAGRLRADFDESGGEFIHVVGGRLICHAEDGTVTELVPGDTMTFPPGWKGIWECPVPMRKFYTVFKLER